MRSKKKLSIGNFIIDLTPLLDVILLMLIVVLAGNDDANDKYSDAETKYAEATSLVSDMEIRMNDNVAQIQGDYDTVLSQLNSYERMYEYVNLVTIYANYTPSNKKYRQVHVIINDSEVETWDLNPSNEDTVWGQVKEYIEMALADSEGTPTFVSIKYNDVNMLYRDEESIQKLREELELSNLYRMTDAELGDE